MEYPKYCPECGAEYTQEAVNCSDCNVPLGWDPPTEGPAQPAGLAEPVELVTVLRVSDAKGLVGLAMAKSLLESEGIPYIEQERSWYYAIELQVPRDAEEAARKLLDELAEAESPEE